MDPPPKRLRPSCAVCAVEEACPETAGGTPSGNATMRRIMAIELTKFGTRPDAAIYADIAAAYNDEIRAPMAAAGLDCPAWTPSSVRVHFERHVDLVPRRIVARQIRSLEALAADLEQRCEPGPDDEVRSLLPRAGELTLWRQEETGMDTKDMKVQIDLAKAITALAKEYRAFQREDQASCGVDAILRSVQLGETSAQDAQRMLETAALARCATGTTEIPRASELFD